MIMPWNRKEVYTGQSMDQFYEVRDILVQNKIAYTYRVINQRSSRIRNHIIDIGLDTSTLYTYILYVHQHHAEEAGQLIAKALH